jgi:hypothetical protein
MEGQCCVVILAWYNYLVQLSGLPLHKIVMYGKGKGCSPACWLMDALCQEGAALSVVVAGTMTRTTTHGATGSLGEEDTGARMRMPLLGGIALHSAILSPGSGGTLAAMMLALVAKDEWPGWQLPVYLLHGTDKRSCQ